MATYVVNGGPAIVTNRLKGSGTEPVYIGWGTGAGTTAKTDTTLFTEALVSLSAGTSDHTTGTSARTTVTNTNDNWQLTGTRTATAGGSVTNAGLWDAASAGSLFFKGDFTSIGLANGDSINFTFNVQFINN